MKVFATCLDLHGDFEHCDECHEDHDLTDAQFGGFTIACCCEGLIWLTQHIGGDNAKRRRVSKRKQEEATVQRRETAEGHTIH